MFQDRNFSNAILSYKMFNYHSLKIVSVNGLHKFKLFKMYINLHCTKLILISNFFLPKKCHSNDKYNEWNNFKYDFDLIYSSRVSSYVTNKTTEKHF